ncbi:hypothetical protein Aab01nite_64270 [Paractinoplanes abujensis]|uniref:Uncharacterized protein n=1 Tax=Paractinoplanes abujensis TaxID=882441 RepID=A0A7W7G1F9_9ACTN|nr:hypothetical protein [Actinoplanes abujensis]MBB4692662.1 hypothetical protein [Actinoplanes abujensis]GID22837.1 hypothetical protein Aab01nite_64270 [Actinoplanes abujensis]
MDDPVRGDEEDTYPFLSGAAGFAYRGENRPHSPPAPRAADHDEPPTAELPVVPPVRGRPATYGGRKRRPRAAAMGVAGAVLAGVSSVVVAGLAGGGERSPAPPRADGGPVFVSPGPPAFGAGTFELVSDVPELHLTLGRPDAGPIRVSAPPGGGPAPAASVAGDQVRLAAGPGAGRLDVVLDERIAWTIRMNGGVRAATFVLTGGVVREVDLAGGADSVVLALPRSDRVLPIRMSGGVRQWSIRTEGEVPVQVVARFGAGEVRLYGRRERGIGQNTTLTAGAGSGLEVTAAAGFGSLVVSSE